MNLFGKKKSAPAPKLSDSIQQLREAQQMLDKREKHLEKQMQQAKEQAKDKLKGKDKRGALFLLKRAKLYETQINQIYGKRQNIDMQVMALEAASSNKEIFNVMKLGKDALKQATAQTDVDQVADVMEDINESIQMAEEVNEALSQPIGPQLDEDELNAELAEMENELIDKDLMDTPVVPVHDIKSQPIIKTTTIEDNINIAPVKSTSPKQPVVIGANGNSSSHAPAKKANVTDKEAEELKQLEALMGS